MRERASSSLPVVEAVDPLDISDQEKTEDWVSVDQVNIINQEEPQDLASFERTVISDHKKKEDFASVEQTEYEADHPMSSFSGTISSGNDAYLENDRDVSYTVCYSLNNTVLFIDYSLNVKITIFSLVSYSNTIVIAKNLGKIKLYYNLERIHLQTVKNSFQIQLYVSIVTPFA